MHRYEDHHDENEIHLLPGQCLCECNRVIEQEERLRCAHCGREGCAHCLKSSTAPDADANGEYVCGRACDIAWMERILAYYEANEDEIVEKVLREVAA